MTVYLEVKVVFMGSRQVNVLHFLILFTSIEETFSLAFAERVDTGLRYSFLL